MWREGLPRMYSEIHRMPASVGIGFEHLCIKLGKGGDSIVPDFGASNQKYRALVEKTVQSVNPF